MIQTSVPSRPGGRRAALGVLFAALLFVLPAPADAAWYLAGWSKPQNNSWGGKNESADPPAAYHAYNTWFYGAYWFDVIAHRGTLFVRKGQSRVQPELQRSFGSFRFDDIVFSCADARSNVTLRPRVVVSGDLSWPYGLPDNTVGVFGLNWPAWGGSANWGSWKSDTGGTSSMSGIPAGTSFGPTLVLGPSSTVATGSPISRTWGFTTEVAYARGIMEGTLSLPTDGPVFELPEGCTCNSAEGNIVDNRWLGVDPVVATVSVSGVVTSECDGALADVAVDLTDADGLVYATTTGPDGSYSFPDVTASAAAQGTIRIEAPADHEPLDDAMIALDTDATYDATLMCKQVDVSGSLASDCTGPLEGVEITLVDGEGTTHTVASGPDGTYLFAGIRYSTTAGTVSVTVPAAYSAPAGSSVSVDLSAGATADFALVCVRVDVTGTVASSCGGALNGVAVDLLDAQGAFHTTTTDESGAYAFADLAFSAAEGAAEVSITIPLGYEAITPGVEGAALTLDQDREVAFTLACLEPSGDPRSMGYWKHQANVYLSGRGHAQEAETDMVTNFPRAVFDHFHENTLNGIAVEGVTYMGSPATPLDLATIGETLTVSHGTMLDRAKQQYLAFLLNLASGKILTSTVLSADGATASQIVQYVADLINDGDPGNDELAKDICDTLNNARQLGAGVVPLDDYGDIAFAIRRLAEEPLRVSPNPGAGGVRPFVFSFGMPVAGPATLDIFDVQGRRVATPLSRPLGVGRAQVSWNGTMASGARAGGGVYFGRLSTPQGTKTVKFVHLGR